MQTRKNRRGHEEHFIECRHLKLDELKQNEKVKRTHLYETYLYKGDIPPYPGPQGHAPEFHVSHLQHDTEINGLIGIKNNEGFKGPNNGSGDPEKLPLVWWSLAVSPQEIQEAETRLLKATFSNPTEQQDFLGKFATSPAFSEKSRYGSCRFIFTVEEVLEAYRKQFCSGKPPVLRVFRTYLYKQEVLYAVLVHSPDNNRRFEDYPELPDGSTADAADAVCVYSNGRFIWRPEAMCGTHRFKLIHKPEEERMDAQLLSKREKYYVWDHVGLTLHMEHGQVLKFKPEQLSKKLSFCEEDDVTVIRKTTTSRLGGSSKPWSVGCGRP